MVKNLSAILSAPMLSKIACHQDVTLLIDANTVDAFPRAYRLLDITFVYVNMSP